MAKVGRLVKEVMLQDLTEALASRPNFLVTSLGRIEAVEMDTLRKQLRGMHARVLMTKRTLGLRGVSGLTHAPDPELFQGSVAWVFPGEDLIPAAKLLVDFSKANQDKLLVRGGLVEGQLLNSHGIEELANLPSRTHLLAQLIGTLEAPVTELIMTLEQAMGDVAWILEEASKTARPADQAGGPAERRGGEEVSQDADPATAAPPTTATTDAGTAAESSAESPQS